MKRNLSPYLSLFALLVAFTLVSCKQETNNKIEGAGDAVVEETVNAAEKVGEAAQKVGNAAEDAAESVGEAAGKAAENMGEAASKVAKDMGIAIQQVSFDGGANSKTIEATLTGDEIIDYLVNVKSGQYMNVSMATDNAINYFNIMEPDEAYEAIFVGSSSGNQFESTAAKSGDYRIRVYLMRSAARRGEKANFRLEIVLND